MEQPDQATSAGSAPPSYVQSIIAPAGGATTETAPEAAPPPPAEQAPPPGTTPETKPDEQQVEQVIQQIAQEWGVDPNDPAHRRALKRIADGQVYIRQLQAEKETLTKQGQEAKAATAPGQEGLTELERALLAEDAKPPEGTAVPAAAPAATPATPPPPAEFTQAVGQWKGPADALKEYAEAWSAARDGDEGAYPRIAAIENRQFVIRLMAVGQPIIRKLAQEMIQAELSEYTPHLRESLETNRDREALDTALAELKKVPQFASVIDELYKVTEGPSVVYDGQEFPNTPLNRILAKHRGITNIRIDHPDPRQARVLTRLNQIREAALIFIEQQKPAGITPATAEQLVKAGMEMGARTGQDNARQTINAGGGASALGSRPAEGSYVRTLLNLPGGASHYDER